MATTRDTKTIDHGLLKFINRRNKIDGHGVKFGIQADAGKDNEGKVDILDYALINEYGVETIIKKGPRKGQPMKIPARPFMRDFFDKNRRTIMFAMDRAAKLVDDGKPAGAVLAQLGQYVEGKQKKHVQDSKSWAKPNEESTIARKGSDKPLVDDGLLLGAIRYVKI